MDKDSGRFFIAFDVQAPWPKKLPAGRILEPDHRHLTLAFLGQHSRVQVLEQMQDFPTPPFSVAPVGVFDKLLLLPHHHPRVAAWHAHWPQFSPVLETYHRQCRDFLLDQNYKLDLRPLKPHVTLARKPFSPRQWREAFCPLPFYVSSLNLYESLGHCRYQSAWELPFLPPFQEMEHTADLAFQVLGRNPSEILAAAQTALSFSFPEMTPFIAPLPDPLSLDDVILALNEWITRVDIAIGSPCKAVTYSGTLKTNPSHLSWEMIVDV